MNNKLLQIKIKERLNKSASLDFDNFECWQIVEAFNKVQLEFSRLEAKKGEDNKETIEGFNILLVNAPLKGSSKKDYFESVDAPSDFLSYKRIAFGGSTKDCPEPRRFKSYLVPEADIEDIYADVNRTPSFDWAETVITMVSNRFRIHTNDKFEVHEPSLVYYRKPLEISMIGCVNPSTGTVSTKEQICEFKDDIAEILVDLTAAVLAGDIENMNQFSRNTQNAQKQE